MRLTLNRAQQRTKVDHIRFRPWIQGFADYAFDKRQFGSVQIQGQIRAAEGFGSDGWLLWNPRNVYSAESLKPAAKQLQSHENPHAATGILTAAK